jgi:hypothetical protein
MKRTLQAVFLTVFAAQVLVIGQAADVKRVLADIRAALGGEAALGAVRTLAIEGTSERASSGGAVIVRRAGFNGADVIQVVDGPPGMTMRYAEAYFGSLTSTPKHWRPAVCAQN